MKDGSPNVRLGEAWKVCPPVGVIAVASLYQASQPTIATDRRSLGLSAGRNEGHGVEPDAGCPGSDGFDA